MTTQNIVALRALVATAMFAILPTAVRAQTKFIPLGDLAGGETHSEALAVSADGTTIVGVSISKKGSEATRWTESEGLRGLGDLAGGNFNSAANAVSEDGSVIVGFGTVNGRPLYFGISEAFRWTATDGMQPLGGTRSEFRAFRSEATSVSADGQVIVGTAIVLKPGYNGLPYDREAAVRWTGAGRMELLQDYFPDDSWSRATAMSADGRTVVGYCQPSFQQSQVPTFWLSGLAQGVEDVIDGFRNFNFSMTGSTLAVSSDGAHLTGAFVKSNGKQLTPAFFIGSEQLGFKVINEPVVPAALTNNGKYLVGSRVTKQQGEAVIWDPENGVRPLQQILEDAGLNLQGWTLLEAKDITPDGKTIVGTATNPDGNTEAWLLRWNP